VRKNVLIGSATALVLLILLVLFALNRVTPVEHEQAVRRFHAERQEIGQHPDKDPAPATMARSKDRPDRARRGSTERGEAPVSVVPAAAEQQPSKGTPPPEKKEHGFGNPGKADPEAFPTMPVAVRPAEGVYSYKTDGHEGFEGIFDREFPPISHRTIIHTGPTTWSDHTIFSEERESWNTFEFTEGKRRVRSQRNRIKFAAYERDETVTFNPPILTTTYPWELGRTWRGTFSGETYGSFEARTVRREYMTVGGEPVHAWADRLDVELHGRIEGEVTATRWLSPEYGLTLREEYRADARLGPIHYIAEWSVTLRSVRPSV